MKKLLTFAAVLCALNTTTVLAHGTEMEEGHSVYLEHALDTLPHEQAENFRDAMQEAHDQNKELYGQVHTLHEQMHALLTAKEFDQDAFLQKTEELRQLHDQISAKVDQAFAYGVADLSQADRQKLASALERSHEAKKAAHGSTKSGAK